jgi:SAM-dependent methyltransferase
MPERDWNESYATGQLPWDTGEPDRMLVEFVRAGRVAPGRALEIGAGTGTNALWLAQQGFDVLAVDVSKLAVEQARAKAASAPRCRFEVGDFLAAPPAGTFTFVFDRGCFHIFDEAADRARFAANVAARLAPGGVWLSLIGSTEGPAREMGPPRRTVRDLADAIEPVLAFEELAATKFDLSASLPDAPTPPAWRCVTRARTVPAQPSTRHP